MKVKFFVLKKTPSNITAIPYVASELNGIHEGANNLQRNDLIAILYHSGYTIKEIIGFLALCRGIAISERQVHRLLRNMNLYRRRNEASLEDIVKAILQELSGTGQHIGYRTMKRRLLTQHVVVASSEIVRLALSVLDAEGVLARRQRVFRRRTYFNRGPNFAVHTDGWDKLKPFGISIHAAIDGFSRRILWLYACSSNKNPRYIAHYYINYIKEIQGIPYIIYADRGTENAITRDLQYALRLNHNDPFQGLSSFMYGSSTRNCRIERFWKDRRSMCGQTWITLFKTMRDHGLFDPTDNILLECMRYCFLSFINKDLMDAIRHWNEHRVRPSRNAIGPFGKPDVLYFQPEIFGARDYKMPIPGNIDAIEREYCSHPEANELSQDFEALASAIIGQNRLHYPPSTVDEAVRLFCEITSDVDVIA